MAEQKKPVTFSVNEDIKKQFQVECVINGIEMSETIQGMMVSYITVSRKHRLNSDTNID